MESKYDNTVEVVVAPLIRNAEGKILLIKSPKWGDAYLLPGGHVEASETIFETAVREGEEETGLKLIPRHVVNVGELINDPDYERKAHLIFIHVLCDTEADEVRIDGVEIHESLWMDVHVAVTYPQLAKGIRQTIQNYLDGVEIPFASQPFD